jgi:FtsP/CotA-like multicopper oxidase with cupredoxin domain
MAAILGYGAHQFNKGGKTGVGGKTLFISGINLLANNPYFKTPKGIVKYKIINISTAFKGVPLQCLFSG